MAHPELLMSPRATPKVAEKNAGSSNSAAHKKEGSKKVEPELSSKAIQKSSYSKYGGTILNHEQYDLHEMRKKEMVFCVANEATILSTVQEVLSYYNLDLYLSVWGAN